MYNFLSKPWFKKGLDIWIFWLFPIKFHTNFILNKSLFLGGSGAFRSYPGANPGGQSDRHKEQVWVEPHIAKSALD